jgi:hypothetical protein
MIKSWKLLIEPTFILVTLMYFVMLHRVCVTVTRNFVHRLVNFIIFILCNYFHILRSHYDSQVEVIRRSYITSPYMYYLLMESALSWILDIPTSSF